MQPCPVESKCHELACRTTTNTTEREGRRAWGKKGRKGRRGRRKERGDGCRDATMIGGIYRWHKLAPHSTARDWGEQRRRIMWKGYRVL